jgi:tRNA-2-methylthio-N6-dimethylallyladenosine synthase
MQNIWVSTYGCQMNERDSEEVLGMLTAHGCEVVPESDAADVSGLLESSRYAV